MLKYALSRRSPAPLLLPYLFDWSRAPEACSRAGS
jgi:hypothetical protein